MFCTSIKLYQNQYTYLSFQTQMAVIAEDRSLRDYQHLPHRTSGCLRPQVTQLHEHLHFARARLSRLGHYVNNAL